MAAGAGRTAYRSEILGVVPEQPEPDFLVPRARHDGPVRLAEPDPGWAAQFTREEERIRAALGPRAVQVEHVGSTSVPGLAAKPLIDIVLTVRDSADEAAYVPDLTAAGYVLVVREPDWYEHRFLRNRKADVQIHVFTVGSPEVERMLTFRDRLRTDPRSGSCTSAPSASWRPDAGTTSRTTPMRNPLWWRKSSPAPRVEDESVIRLRTKQVPFVGTSVLCA